ncbi:major facilitator superfamily domain-containing protein [Armillaria nabsnona]|nr:major facilitator superfamily domain-containing protein [Armillaria nabsnona]
MISDSGKPEQEWQEEFANTVYEPGSEVEKILVRKIDRHIGAFSGLLAGVITDNLDGARGVDGRKWLLLIEGVTSSFGAYFTWMILPDWPSTTKWLPPEKRFIAIQGLAYEDIGNTATGESYAPSHKEAFYLAINDWCTWASSFTVYMLATGAQTTQYFVPSLVGQLGYTGYTKQYMTIPKYMVAFVGIVFFCFLSDIKKERGNYVTITSLIAGVSFIITVAVDNQKVKYYAACPLTLLWVSGVIDHPAEKRAVAIAIVNGLGNSASIYGSFLWPSNTGPRYVQGFALTTYVPQQLEFAMLIMKVLLKRYPSKGLNDDLALAKGVKDVDAGGSNVFTIHCY